MNYLIKELLQQKNEDLKLANTEIPHSLSNKNSSYADIILKNNELEYIIEMNYSFSRLLYYKNYYYLFKEHTKRLYKSNYYGLTKKTILINIDNYDFLKKNKLIYVVSLNEKKYNETMYKNIECIHINLDFLKKKYYNGYKLNKLEKLLLIFIEQNKKKLLKACNNKYAKELIEYMDYLQIGDDYITVYNKEEFDKAVKDEFEEDKRKFEEGKRLFEKKKKKLESDKTKFESDKTKFESDKIKLESDKTKLESDKTKLEFDKTKFEREKIKFAKDLKINGIPVKKIIELTRLSEKQINML